MVAKAAGDVADIPQTLRLQVEMYGEDKNRNGVIDDVHGFNGINESGDPMDDNGHGTHVAGTVLGSGAML